MQYRPAAKSTIVTSISIAYIIYETWEAVAIDLLAVRFNLFTVFRYRLVLEQMSSSNGSLGHWFAYLEYTIFESVP